MKNRRAIPAIFILCLGLFLAIPCSIRAQYKLNGNATSLSPTCFELTPDATGQAGSVWYTSTFNLTKPFDLKFNIFLGCKGYSSGADGIVFVFQPLSINAGSAGGGMGFQGINPSVGVEFDTYQNGWDPAFCHVAIEKNGNVDHTNAATILAAPVQLSPTGAGLPDCNSHPARITWNPATKILNVYFDCSLRISYTGDIVNTIFGGNPNVFWGFTAGTGGASNVQAICLENTYLNNLRDTTICLGASVPLATSGGVSYAWSPSAGLSSTTVSNPLAKPLVTTKYNVTITDSCGFQSFDSTLITVVPLKDSVTVSKPVSCNGGNDGSASAVLVGGTGTMTYAWTPSGGNSGTAAALTANTYTSTVTDSRGCYGTTTVLISQPLPIQLSVSGVPASCHGTCNGQLICIPVGGTSPYTYSWTSGCTSAACNNICVGTYTLTVTDFHNCKATKDTVVTEPPALVLSMASVAAHCNQADGTDSVFVSGGVPGYTYSWSPGAGTASSAYHNIVPGCYTVTVHDANNCLQKDTLSVQNLSGVTASISAFTNATCFGATDGTALASGAGGAGGDTYSWTPSGGTAAAAGNLAAGNYTCTVTDSKGCSAKAVAAVAQPALLTNAAMTPVSICINQSVPLTATGAGGTPAYTYSWTNTGTAVNSPVSPLATTTYTVNCTDKNGCGSVPSTVTITVRPPLSLSMSATQPVCPGGSVPLGVTVTGGDGNYTFTWSPALGLTSTGIQDPTATLAVTTTYTVSVSDGCGTPLALDSVVAVAYPVPVPSFMTNDSAGCVPFCTNFSGSSIPACALAGWKFGDGGTATGCGTVSHCYQTAGPQDVSLFVTDIHGCKAYLSKTAFIHVYPLPLAAFTASPQPADIMSPLITYTNEGSGAVSWKWFYGETAGVSDTTENAAHKYLDTGCYPVMLIAKSSHACLDTAQSEVCIRPYFTFYAPNAFSPNDDGRNDIWKPVGMYIDPDNYELNIYDRWGNRVFNTTSWDKGWDGKANGGSVVAEVDVYIWVIALKDIQGNRHNYTGICSLIR
jgi:gliding motility-associated-like protein